MPKKGKGGGEEDDLETVLKKIAKVGARLGSTASNSTSYESYNSLLPRRVECSRLDAANTRSSKRPLPPAVTCRSLQPV